MDEDEKELYRMRGRLCALALVIWTLRVVTTVMGWIARLLPSQKKDDDWHIHDMAGLKTYVGPRDGCPYLLCGRRQEKDD